MAHSKSRLATIATVIRVLVLFPIMAWMSYQILDRVNASELMWFLYWAYVPIAVIAIIIAGVGAISEDD